MYFRKIRITKLLATALLLVFIYNSIGYFLIFKCAKSCIKEIAICNMRVRRLDKASKRVAVHRKELKNINWIEEGREMYCNGKRYDVARRLETVDSIVYYCFSDVKEDELFSQLEDHMLEHVILPEQGSSTKKIKSDAFKLYFSIAEFFSFELHTSSFFSIPSCLTDYMAVYIELNPPPPKIIC